MTLLLAVSACDQSPDDDSSRAVPPMDKAQHSSQNDQSRGDPNSARQSSFATTYELQGAPGEPRQFPTKAKCDVARAAQAEAQAKDDKKLSGQGVVFPNRPLLACVPL